jgi:hypothetical protein
LTESPRSSVPLNAIGDARDSLLAEIDLAIIVEVGKDDAREAGRRQGVQRGDPATALIVRVAVIRGDQRVQTGDKRPRLERRNAAQGADPRGRPVVLSTKSTEPPGLLEGGEVALTAAVSSTESTPASGVGAETVSVVLVTIARTVVARLPELLRRRGSERNVGPGTRWQETSFCGSRDAVA